MAPSYPVQTTVSYLHWIIDDLSVARTGLSWGNGTGASLIEEAIDQINSAIGSCYAMGHSSERPLRVAVLQAEITLEAAAYWLNSSGWTCHGDDDLKTLVHKSLKALFYLRSANTWSRV